MKALWEGSVVAESGRTILIEGNHYFPPDSLDMSMLEESTTTSTCPWKGEASYYNVVVDGKRSDDAAWYYPRPKRSAIEAVGSDFSNYVAFWKGVEVVE